MWKSIVQSIAAAILSLAVAPPSKTVTSGLTFTMSSRATPKAPNLPLPKPLDSLTPGTWAHDTMTRRIDSEILQRTYDENEAEFTSPSFVPAMAEFEALREELRNAGDTKLRYLRPDVSDAVGERRKEELEEWRNILAPYIEERGDTWLSCPWMLAEFYLYRRLLEALGYFDPSSPNLGYDPFAKQKQMGLVQSLSLAAPILSKMDRFLDVDVAATAAATGEQTSLDEGMGLAVAFALWGNKMDLSIWPTDSSQDAAMPGIFDAVLRSAVDNLLCDDTSTLVRHVTALRDRTAKHKNENKTSSSSPERKPTRIDIVVDNAGFELVMDLVLADYLLSARIADVVRFQLKSHPTFVSDATESDLRRHVSYYAEGLGGDAATETTRRAGRRWEDHLTAGRWECHEHSFWVQPPPMWEMPGALRGELEENCDLAVVKGDANYRRLLGDREWDFVEDGFEDVVGAYFPCPVVALRTLKAEVGCGMDRGAVERVRDGEDEEWKVNGRYGVVQFSKGSGK